MNSTYSTQGTPKQNQYHLAISNYARFISSQLV